MSTIAGLAHAGSLNQSGPSIPIALRPTLIGPVAGLNMKTKASVAATGGARAGRKNRVRNSPPPRLTVVRIIDTPSPKIIRAGTRMTTSQSVLRTACQTFGSLVKKNS